MNDCRSFSSSSSWTFLSLDAFIYSKIAQVFSGMTGDRGLGSMLLL